VQLGENLYGPRALFQAIRAEASDYVMPDLMRIGGVTGWLRAAAIAGAAGIEMSTHLYPEMAGHLMRVTETAHWLEWQDWANPILAEPFRLENGHLLIPRSAGQRHRMGRGRDQPLSAGCLSLGASWVFSPWQRSLLKFAQPLARRLPTLPRAADRCHFGAPGCHSKPVDSALNLSWRALSRTTPISASEKPEGVSASISRVIFTLVVGLR